MNMQLKINLFTATWTLLFLALISCGEDKLVRSDLGTAVNVIRKGDGPPLIDNQIVFLQIRFENDTGGVINESSLEEPLRLQYKEDLENVNGQFQSVLELLSVGDSVTFVVPAKDLYEKTFQTAVPPALNPESNIFFQLSIVDQMDEVAYRSYEEERFRKFSDERLEIEGTQIEELLKRENLTAVTTESGLRYVIIKEGNGDKAQVGQSVKVKYRGTLMANGSEFDAGEFSFNLGAGRVIAGWDEGISYLTVGTQAILYIPSPLGYGSRGAGPNIPPNSPLVFEVELLSIN